MRLCLMLMTLFCIYANAQQADNTPLNSVFTPANSEQIKEVETFIFKSDEVQYRAIDLARELRCPQCLNQNLMESNSPIAKDLRLIVYKMVDEGKTNRQIIDFMTTRFGDFVLYNPKFEPRTYLLWLGPIILLLLFTIIGVLVVRRSIRHSTK